MPGGIDYSKWDNLDEYSDDDDEAEGASGDQAPRVTRLDAPSSVTFGGDTNVIQGTAAASAPVPSATAASQILKVDFQAATSNASKAGHSQIDQWRAKGGLVTTSLNRELYWTQDRYSVTLRCQMFEGEKPKTVGVEGILPYSSRHCAMGSSKPRLQVVGSDGVVMLEGDLPHQVHLANEDDDVDWSVERDLGGRGTKRFVAITLYKAVPMQGLSVWWRRPLMDFDEITLDQESSAASKEFLQAWEEAHRQFKEKKRNPPVPL
mmetsp:Transcript_77710/g.116874  ORF Transcript_77710/g.116874 Transcript_77710/m.116874 type:complete len:263 (+) Transcript_77710:47-835(+)